MGPIETPAQWSRRRWLSKVLYGAGWLGLRSLASGIPREVLASPHAFVERVTPTVAERLMADASRAQFLLLSCSDDGDPLNCNMPGTYADPKILHPTQASMAATSYRLGDAQVTAALPWAQLPSSILSRMSFLHAKTGHAAHGDLPQVQTLDFAVASGEMMGCAFAKGLAAPLGTLQTRPLDVSGYEGPEALLFDGDPQPVFTPTSVCQLLRTPAMLADFDATQALRDRDLDALNQLVRSKGTPSQQALIDSWATSQAQARQMPRDVVASLDAIRDNSVQAQLTVAVLLFRLKITPVVKVHLPFGGDNHVDNNTELGPGPLPQETAEHISSLAALATVMDTAKSFGLQDKITLSAVGTFGRRNALNLGGRQHNPEHVGTFIIGANVKPCVVGGVVLQGDTLVAQDADAATGRVAPGGDVPAASSMASYGKTLGRALGLNAADVDKVVTQGKPVAAALLG